MRKTLSTLALLIFLSASLNSCGKKEETTTTTGTTELAPDASVNAIETVASDKEKLRQAIILASSKGTLDDALQEAAQDSVVRDQLRNALAMAGGNARTASTQSTSTSKKSTGTTAAKTPAQKKDAIDQANDALDKTNRTIERTTETVNKANDAARRADELLRGGRR